jgi:Asp-tRNA(Asn)/Glu-tRNA(Gln) amidotransferase A subunit family amidase
VSEPRDPEASIADLQAALAAGWITVEALVGAQLARVAALDGPGCLGALVALAPDAMDTARGLDARFRLGGPVGPLHGVTVIVKDNVDTAGLQTAAGSLALAGHAPTVDAPLVARLRAAGAIVLAKSNMAELAFEPTFTESSLAGITRNPYDPSRVPAGSSGGTAAAVAQGLGLVGIGTDTGNSIRGPAAHCGLVGLRPSFGLVPRTGIVPLYLGHDMAGPMTRTVEDAARLLDVIAGPDADDPASERAAEGHGRDGYTARLAADGLRGARLGVLRELTNLPSADPDILRLFERALVDLRAAGATLVDPVVVLVTDGLGRNLFRNTFRRDFDAYLAKHDTPVRSLLDLRASGRFAAHVRARIEAALAATAAPSDPWGDPERADLRRAVLRAMDRARVDALIHPTWTNPPRRVGDLTSPHGNQSPWIAPHTGQPALTVPMGFTLSGLPAGLHLIGRPFDDATLLRLGFAYERVTRHRRPPPQRTTRSIAFQRRHQTSSPSPPGRSSA